MTATELTAAGSREWSAIALSGSLILAAANKGYLYLSTNGGGTFQELTIADSRAAWAGVAIAVSGGMTFQFAAVRNGDILCTANNWASISTWNPLGVRIWTSIAAASTGAASRSAGPLSGIWADGGWTGQRALWYPMRQCTNRASHVLHWPSATSSGC